MKYCAFCKKRIWFWQLQYYDDSEDLLHLLCGFEKAQKSLKELGVLLEKHLGGKE